MDPNAQNPNPRQPVNQQPAQPVQTVQHQPIPQPIAPIPPKTPPPPPPKNKLKSLMLLEVGFLEIAFVVVVLLIFFGVLNYFNVVSLSSLYPNQLGWLPHITKNPGVATQANNLNSTNIPSQSPQYFAPLTKKVGRFAQFTQDKRADPILSGQYPTVVDIKRDSNNKVVMIEAKFFGDKLSSVPSTDLNNTSQYNGLTIWYILNANTTVYQETSETVSLQNPPSTLITGDNLLDNLKIGDVLYEINANLSAGTADRPTLNSDTFKLIQASIGKDNSTNTTNFTLYANQVFTYLTGQQ